MTRKEWKKQAEAHCAAAKALLEQGQYGVAYHVAGLAIECALKAKIATAFKASTWPTKKFVNDIHTHDLPALVKQAGLDASRLKQEGTSPAFRVYWNTVKGWTVESRYKDWSAAEARDMVEAVSKKSVGVLAWIKRNW